MFEKVEKFRVKSIRRFAADAYLNSQGYGVDVFSLYSDEGIDFAPSKALSFSLWYLSNLFWKGIAHAWNELVGPKLGRHNSAFLMT